MEIIAPAADLSEQISTAGKEASVTGNLKLMMNGAVTIGAYDGANIGILEAVGADNTAEEVAAHRGSYQPDTIIAADEDLSRVMQMLESGHFSQLEPGYFEAIVRSVRDPNDPWLTAADFRSYVDASGARRRHIGIRRAGRT